MIFVYIVIESKVRISYSVNTLDSLKKTPHFTVSIIKGSVCCRPISH